MKLIAAVDQHWGIGYGGQLLEVIPADMKFFKEKTIGKIVIMGRATFESLPGGKPLTDRINIVLTKGGNVNCEGVIVCTSVAECLSESKKYNTDDIFVIGGESIYKEFLPYCSTAYITKIEKSYTANKYLPNLDQSQGWQCVSVGSSQQYKELSFTFTVYKNINVISCSL